MKNSYFLGLLSKDSKLQKFFENSLLYSIFAVILSWCLRLVRKIFRVLGGYDSLCYKYITVCATVLRAFCVRILLI